MDIDLRSDTVTLPPPGMREAMSRAALGDDVFGEDPTVRALEARVADLLGKDAALFVPSGTMGNLLASMTHLLPGDEIICGASMHVYSAEAGGAARLAGASTRVVPQDRGRMSPDDIRHAVRADDAHCPRTRLLWMEMPQHGWVVPIDDLIAAADAARSRALAVHLDGARLLNAQVALGVPVRTIAAVADTVMMCFSKGLAAPVGSVLAGSGAFIHRARRNRKVVGGGMRQAGVLAAAGLFALDHMVERLADDHANAQALAAGLRRLGWRLDRDVPETNIFGAAPPDGVAAGALATELAARGVRILLPREGADIRFVTHYGIEPRDVERALAIMAEAMTRAS